MIRFVASKSGNLSRLVGSVVWKNLRDFAMSSCLIDSITEMRCTRMRLTTGSVKAESVAATTAPTAPCVAPWMMFEIRVSIAMALGAARGAAIDRRSAAVCALAPRPNSAPCTRLSATSAFGAARRATAMGGTNVLRAVVVCACALAASARSVPNTILAIVLVI
jgi:hypothetical protein